MTTAHVLRSTLRRLINIARKHTGTDDLLPVLKQVRLRKIGGQLEASATDRYTVAFVVADLDREQSWPDGLELALTLRQWRTLFATLKPLNRYDDGMFSFSVGPARVTIERETSLNMPDAVASLTFPIPAGAFPNVDNLRTVDANAFENARGYAALDGKLLARLPAEFSTLVLHSREGSGSGPVHFLAPDWHIAIMSGRMGDDWTHGQPSASVPQPWAKLIGQRSSAIPLA